MVSERIARKIGSWPIVQWVIRKLGTAMWRRMHKAPEVQKRLEALSAATPNTLEQRKAFVEYAMALQKELEKSKWNAWPPKSAQIEAMLQKLEKGNATASEIEEFRQLAGEVLRNWQPRYSLGFKKRIESALSLLEGLVLQLRENDLGDCLDELSKRWREAFQREGVKLEAKFDPSIPTFRFDYQKVQQVAANLLRSALYHTPSGGSVTLNCMPRPNGVEVSVTGALEHDQKILDGYSTVSPSRAQTFEESLAIGLTIAKRLILAHHGKIWVEASTTGNRYAFLMPMDQG